MSYPRTFIRSPRAIRPTFRPMFPTPMSPRYFPLNSVPINLFFIQFPFFSSVSARVMLRARAIMLPIASSATALIAASDALITRSPFPLALFTSILSRPTPTRAIIFALIAASMTSRLIFVLLLTTMTS